MITIRDFSFVYREGDAPTVSGVNLDIPKGAFVGITGPAGCGKSTLTYALNGIIPHCYPGDFYGSVQVDGLDTCEASLTDISRVVGSVCQDIDSQMVSSIVEDEILYGLENFGVPHSEIEERVSEALNDMGIAELRDRSIASLSGGQKQKVAIASILALRPRVLVLDEPTAELDPASSLQVFELLERYAREHETTVVVVEQKIALLARFASQLVIMNEGRIVFADEPRCVLAHANELASLGVNCPRATTLMNRLGYGVCRNVEEARDMLAEALPTPTHAATMQVERLSSPTHTQPTVLEFRNVHASYDEGTPILRGVSFTIREGEFVAFAGTNGAGKSTTMRLANGLLKPDSGTVLVSGKPTTHLQTSELAQRVGFLFQNPDRQICCPTVREELLFGFRALKKDESEAAKRVDAIIEEFGFNPDDDPFLLNRGTRQLLALASIVVLEPRVIILDEPTTGLDYRECEKVMGIIRRLHASGTTVIMVCHDMEVVADFAERVIVMNEGCVIGDGPTFAMLRSEETLQNAHMTPPQIVELSLTLPLARPDLANTAIARANTLDDMANAIDDIRVNQSTPSHEPATERSPR